MNLAHVASMFLHSKAGVGTMAGLAVAASVDIDALRVAIKDKGIGGLQAYFDHFSIRAALRRYAIGILVGLVGGLTTQGFTG